MMTGTSIYLGTPTAWTRSLSREKRVATRQANRVRTIAVLTLLSLIEGAAIVMGSFPEWLSFTGAVCILINLILIGRLVQLWYREWQRENQIRKQYKG